MSKSYRSSKGRFVGRDNPVAVIGRLQAAREAERERAERLARMTAGQTITQLAYSTQTR